MLKITALTWGSELLHAIAADLKSFEQLSEHIAIISFAVLNLQVFPALAN